MGTLPDQFREDYENYGDSFFAVARMLIEHHDRQFTQSDLADRVDVSQSRVSDFTKTLTDDGWITRRENQTTFEWDTERYNPAEREATDAVLGLYRGLWTSDYIVVSGLCSKRIARHQRPCGRCSA